MSAAQRDIIEAMAVRHGLDLSRYHEDFLAKTLERRRLATGCQNPEAYARHLGHSPEEGKALASALCNTFSEFFRNPLTFAILEQIVLPQLRQSAAQEGGGELRIWSAGCVAGQEAYSVAMLLEDQAAGPEPDPGYRIFATDTSAEELETGRRGGYQRQAMGNLRLRHLEAYFTPQGQYHHILPRLRQRMDFSEHDLLDERLASPPASIFGGFDLILCCNLLFYYRPDLQRTMLDRLERSLAPGGYLAAGGAERALVEQWGGLTTIVPAAAGLPAAAGQR